MCVCPSQRRLRCYVATNIRVPPSNSDSDAVRAGGDASVLGQRGVTSADGMRARSIRHRRTCAPQAPRLSPALLNDSCRARHNAGTRASNRRFGKNHALGIKIGATQHLPPRALATARRAPRATPRTHVACCSSRTFSHIPLAHIRCVRFLPSPSHAHWLPCLFYATQSVLLTAHAAVAALHCAAHAHPLLLPYLDNSHNAL